MVATFPVKKPNRQAGWFFETARFFGTLTPSGLGPIVLYLIGQIGAEWASIAIWVLSVGMLGLRDMLWAAGTWLDPMVEMDTLKIDLWLRVTWLPFAMVGLLINTEVIPQIA